MKTVTYTLTDGSKKTVEYDEKAPCWCCGLPVGSASMGGTVICPACDCGMYRDGRKWTPEDLRRTGENYIKNLFRNTKALCPTCKRRYECLTKNKMLCLGRQFEGYTYDGHHFHSANSRKFFYGAGVIIPKEISDRVPVIAFPKDKNGYLILLLEDLAV